VTNDLTHLDAAGEVHMVDVGGKSVTQRRAAAEAHITMSPEVKELLFGGDLPKGDALAMARVAAIMGAKRAPELIPLSHPIGLDSVEVSIEPEAAGARIEVVCEIQARTGVEMEALTGASVGALALYDMIKGLDRSAAIGPVQLLSKSGGRSGDWNR
jgi:cyclic pyranopterin phosphate synthase